MRSVALRRGAREDSAVGATDELRHSRYSLPGSPVDTLACAPGRIATDYENSESIEIWRACSLAEELPDLRLRADQYGVER